MRHGRGSVACMAARAEVPKVCVLLPAQLAAMRERDPSAKALIFTQFNSTLQWLMQRLTAEGYGYRTISGSMPMKQRSKVCPCMQHAFKWHQ